MTDQTAADLLFGGSMRTSAEVAKGTTEAKTAPGSPEDQAAKIYNNTPQQYVSPFEKPKAEADTAVKAEQTEAKSEADKGEADPKAAEQLKADVGEVLAEVGLDPADAISVEFSDLAVAEGFTKEQAAKLVDLDLRNRETFWANASKQWQEQTLAEFSQADLTSAAIVVKQYGSPGLMKLLESYGLGNHPDIVRFAHNVARATALPRSATPVRSTFKR